MCSSQRVRVIVNVMMWRPASAPKKWLVDDDAGSRGAAVALITDTYIQYKYKYMNGILNIEPTMRWFDYRLSVIAFFVFHFHIFNTPTFLLPLSPDPWPPSPPPIISLCHSHLSSMFIFYIRPCHPNPIQHQPKPIIIVDVCVCALRWHLALAPYFCGDSKKQQKQKRDRRQNVALIPSFLSFLFFVQTESLICECETNDERRPRPPHRCNFVASKVIDW